jgi:HD-like signal output (HDOD) protein
VSLETVMSLVNSLPPLPASVLRVQAVCRREDADVGDIVDALKCDPVLTAYLLKAANSALYGFRGEVKSVSRAVMMFGAGMVRGFAIALTVRKYFEMDMSPYGIANEAFVELAGLQRDLASAWYARVDPGGLAMVSPAAFMMDLGKIVLAKAVDRAGRRDDFLAAVRATDDVAGVEIDFAGLDSHALTAAIFDRWNFEPEITEIIRHAGSPHLAPLNLRRPALVLLVVGRCVSVKGICEPGALAQARAVLSAHGFAPAPFEAALDRLAGHAIASPA